MYDDGVAYIFRTLEKHGPLTLDALKETVDGSYGFHEWNEYLQSAFDYCVDHKRIVKLEDGTYDVDEFFKSPSKPKLVDPNRHYYCKKCFHLLRKLVWMKALRGDGAGIHLCPDCGDAMTMEWNAAMSYCDIYIRHYRKLKEQIEAELDDD